MKDGKPLALTFWELLENMPDGELEILVCESHTYFGAPRVGWKLTEFQFNHFIVVSFMTVLRKFPDWQAAILAAYPWKENKQLTSEETKIYQGNYFNDKKISKEQMSQLVLKAFGGMGADLRGSELDIKESQLEEVKQQVLPLFMRLRALDRGTMIKTIKPPANWLYRGHWEEILGLLKSDPFLNENVWSSAFRSATRSGRDYIFDAPEIVERQYAMKVENALKNMNVADASTMDMESNNFNTWIRQEDFTRLSAVARTKAAMAAPVPEIPNVQRSITFSNLPKVSSKNQANKVSIFESQNFDQGPSALGNASKPGAGGASQMPAQAPVKIFEFQNSNQGAGALGNASQIGNLGAAGVIRMPSQAQMSFNVQAKIATAEKILEDARTNLENLRLEARGEPEMKRALDHQSTPKRTRNQVNYRESPMESGCSIHTGDDSQGYEEDSNGNMRDDNSWYGVEDDQDEQQEQKIVITDRPKEKKQVSRQKREVKNDNRVPEMSVRSPVVAEKTPAYRMAEEIANMGIDTVREAMALFNSGSNVRNPIAPAMMGVMRPTPVIQIVAPPPFAGLEDRPKLAKDWLNCMDEYFENVGTGVDTFQRSKISQLLVGDAANWWLGKISRIQGMTWEVFKQMFRKKWMSAYLDDPVELYGTAVMESGECSTNFLERVMALGYRASINMENASTARRWYKQLPEKLRLVLATNIPQTMSALLAKVELFEEDENACYRDRSMRAKDEDYRHYLSDKKKAKLMLLRQMNDVDDSDSSTDWQPDAGERMIMLIDRKTGKKTWEPYNSRAPVGDPVKPTCLHLTHSPESCWKTLFCETCKKWGHIKGSSACFYCPMCPNKQHAPNELCERIQFFASRLELLPEDLKDLAVKSINPDQHLNLKDQRK